MHGDNREKSNIHNIQDNSMDMSAAITSHKITTTTWSGAPCSSGLLCKKRFPFLLALASLLLGTLTGCASWSVGPDFEKPVLRDMPDQWGAQDPEYAVLGNVPLEKWWQSFNDPALGHLITRAQISSPTIETALLNIAQYRAQYAIAVGSFFPQTQQATGTYTSEHPSQRSASAPQPSEPAQPSTIQQTSVGLQATWEIDLWGKYRRNAEAVKATLLSMHAGYELALVTLSADVAQQYFNYRMVERQLEIARRNNDAQKETVRITEAMFRLGGASERDYAQALAMQKSTEADIPQLEAQRIVSRNALCVLLGTPPGPVAELEPGWRPEALNLTPPLPEGAATRLTPLPAVTTPPPVTPVGTGKAAAKRKETPAHDALFQAFIPAEIAIGVPADLLRRRPDVRQAEQEAAAQCARIGVSKAALFPAFSISGFLGFQSSDVGAYTLAETFTRQAQTASIAPSLVLPILNYGRLYNAVRVQDALFQQSLVTYRQTVLQALQEAENAMSSFLRARQRLQLLQQAATAASRSTKLALDQYNAGSTDFTTVVSAQTTQYQQESGVASAAATAALQAVAIFRAVGGGWLPQPLPLPAATIKAMQERTNWGSMLRDMEGLPGTPPAHN